MKDGEWRYNINWYLYSIIFLRIITDEERRNTVTTQPDAGRRESREGRRNSRSD